MESIIRRDQESEAEEIINIVKSMDDNGRHQLYAFLQGAKFAEGQRDPDEKKTA